MSHDFAKKQKKKPKSSAKRPTPVNPPKKSLPWWVWFFSGVAITLFGQVLIQLANVDTKTQHPSSKPTITWPSSNTQTPKKPDITFYETLKQQEVKVSDKVVRNREDGSYDFSLQAGSFRKRQDAEQLRVEVILLGLEAKINKTVNTNGSTWFRVIVGPFNSRSLFAKSRGILLDNGIRSIRVKNS